MTPNPGYCPAESEGKRVRVWLGNGRPGATDDNPMSPPGWPADGRGGCDWRLASHPFAIAFYEVIP
jgi:hypothetical protein